MASSSYIHLLALLFTLVVVLPLISHCADPSPLQDFCVADLDSKLYLNGFPCKNPSKVTSKDFFYEGLKKDPNNFDDLGVDLDQTSVNQFPGLNTLGMSMNRVAFLPGGLNPPHVHPRASELSLVTEGVIFAGWVSTSGEFYWKVLTAGEMFVIPPGVVHFQLNVGDGDARFYASFNSQNPGVQFVGNALFNSTPSIPDEILSKALRVNATIIDIIKSKFKLVKKSS